MSVGSKIGVLGSYRRVLGFWVTIVTDAASLSHLAYDRIKHVSRVGTHRSNEWDGRCGQFVLFHAARDLEQAKD
jgi:hypothetical protein